MNTETMILDALRQFGRNCALDLRARAAGLTGTEIIAEDTFAPPFDPEKDYREWPVGAPVRDGDQTFTLIQPYNAAHYPGVRPKDYPAGWSPCHTKDPAKAKPYMPPNGQSGLWMLDEVCTENGRVYRNKYVNNDFQPSAMPDRWTDLGTIEEIQG